jgi:hypothetical protein
MNEISLPVVVLISFATVLSTLAASWGVVRFQGSQHDKRIARLDERCEALGRELASFKLEAANRFVTDEMMTKLEERVIGAIDRLADRLDRIIENRVTARRGNQS